VNKKRLAFMGTGPGVPASGKTVESGVGEGRNISEIPAKLMVEGTPPTVIVKGGGGGYERLNSEENPGGIRK